jgi:hypothetical protein
MENTSVIPLTTTATHLVAAQRRDVVQLALLKRALTLSGQSALQLVQAAARPLSYPPHLGTIIDTWA